MANPEDVFKVLILQEFLSEPSLQNECKLAELATQLGEILAVPAARAIETFLNLKVGSSPSLDTTTNLLINLVQVKHTTLVVRAAADLLALAKSSEDNYDSCCRNALSHAVQGSYQWAFGALQAAASKNDACSKHHYIYGLIHGATGNFERAAFELNQAFRSGISKEKHKQILEALTLAQQQILVASKEGEKP